MSNQKSWLQELEDLLRWRLVWDPSTKKFKKMLVYNEEDLKSEKDNDK